jgi:hypothetical protein
VLNPAPLFKPLSITAFSDADWRAYPNDRKSTLGLCIYLESDLVSWWSKKQMLVAQSSTEAEYRSLANTASEVFDNLSTTAFSHNPVRHAKTKYMEYGIREKVINSSHYIPATTSLQICRQNHFFLSDFYL